jgi:hypothetical protein
MQYVQIRIAEVKTLDRKNSLNISFAAVLRLEDITAFNKGCKKNQIFTDLYKVGNFENDCSFLTGQVC